MIARYLWIAGIIVVADQLTKWAAVKFLVRHVEVAVMPFLNLTLVHNTGAAFGFLASAGGWQKWFFIVIALAACGIVVYMLRRLTAGDLQLGVALALILGGAVGNLIDRVLYGYVIDFVDFYVGHWHWPAFNVADSTITIGAILLVLDALGLRLLRARVARA